MSGFGLFPPSPGRARPLRCSPLEPDPCRERGAGAVAQGSRGATSPPSPPAGRAPQPPCRAPAWGDAGQGEGCPDPCFAKGQGVLSQRRVWLCPVACFMDEGTGCAHTHLVVGSWGPRGRQPPGCAKAPRRLHASWGHSAGAGLGSIMRAPVGCGLQADLSLSPFLSSGPDPALLVGTKPMLCVPSGAGAS